MGWLTNSIASGTLFRVLLVHFIERGHIMSSNLFWFFATSILILILLPCLVFWRTKSTIKAFYDGLVFPALVICFFFLLPQVGVIIAFLSTMGVLFILSIISFLLNEYSTIFHNCLQRESKISGEISHIWNQKRKEICHEHL